MQSPIFHSISVQSTRTKNVTVFDVPWWYPMIPVVFIATKTVPTKVSTTLGSNNPTEVVVFINTKVVVTIVVDVDYIQRGTADDTLEIFETLK